MISCVFSPAFLKYHIPKMSHPETPYRLKFIIKGILEISKKYKIKFYKPRNIPEKLLLLGHTKEYIQKIKLICNKGFTWIDNDTYVTSSTYNLAKLAVGAVIAGIKLILDESENFCYCIVRPPGHHAGKRGKALSAISQGFCIFNNVALGSLYLYKEYKKKVAIIDIDAHHGNGTQEILYDKPILYISLHQDPSTLYPGTGFTEEIGEKEGLGLNINIPLPPHSSYFIFTDAVESIVLPILESYKPDIIFVSLGFDGLVYDYISSLDYTFDCFYYFYNQMKSVCNKIISAIEGGYTKYNREAIKYCIYGLLDEPIFLGKNRLKEPIKKWLNIKNYLINILKNYWII